MSNSYAGKILRLDLTHLGAEALALPADRELRLYLGGSGLALHFLKNYLLRTGLPLTPSNLPVIFMTGTLTGTPVPSSADFSLVSVDSSAGLRPAIGHSHGYWGPRLKFSGYDGLILVGQAPRPVFLEISPEGNCRFRDAKHLWGKGTRETERLVLRELGGSSEEMSVLTIGPAGERGFPEALVKNDQHYGVSRGSVGALLGQKNIKAISVRGSTRPETAQPQMLQEVASLWSRRLFQDPGPGHPPKGRLLKDAGFLRREIHETLNDPGIPISPQVEALISAAPTWKVNPFSSFNCEIACSFQATITSGPLQGTVVRMGGGSKCLEGETERFGIVDPAAALALTDYCEEIGWQPSRAVEEIADLLQKFQRGEVPGSDLGGSQPRMGDLSSALELLDFLLAHPERFPTPPFPQPNDALSSEEEIPAPQIPLPLAASTGREFFFPRDLFVSWIDCCGVCQFAAEGVPEIEDLLARALGAATGWEDFSVGEGLAVSQRIARLEEEVRRILKDRKG